MPLAEPPRPDSKVIAYLLSNRYLESAAACASPSTLTFDAVLLNAFDDGLSHRFFPLFNVLSKNTKLDFYLHVYFFIRPLHPALNPAPQPVDKQQLKQFKIYLDMKGPQLAQETEYLEFFSLPFVKKPLEHPAFKHVFKKDWVDSLRHNLSQFLKKQARRIRDQANNTRGDLSKPETQQWHQGLRSQQLQEQLDIYIDKFKRMQIQLRSMAEGARTTLLQSQSKWFQITKQLVQCSKSLITLISHNSRELTSERKFLNIKKKIDRYDKFVAKKLQDMISHSQDISIFDRPSINELSCTILPYTQKIVAVPVVVEEFVPTNYKKLREALLGKSYSQRTGLLLKGIIWRILKSKDPFVRRLNIIGLLSSDALGVKNGAIMGLLRGPAMVDTLRLLYYMEHDYYARNILFGRDSKVLLDGLASLLREHSLEPSMLQLLVPMLQIISVRQDMKLQLIRHNVIGLYLGLLHKHLDLLSENVVEYMAATLLNLSCRQEGVEKFEQEEQVFQILGTLLECEDTLARVIVNGTIYSLLGRPRLYEQAIRAGLPQVIDYIIQNDPQANLKELKILEAKIAVFDPAKPTVPSQDVDEIMEEDSLIQYEEELGAVDDYIKGHEYLSTEFALPPRQASAQVQQIRRTFDHSLNQLKKKQASERKSRNSPSADPKNFISNPEPGLRESENIVASFNQNYNSLIEQPPQKLHASEHISKSQISNKNSNDGRVFQKRQHTESAAALHNPSVNKEHVRTNVRNPQQRRPREQALRKANQHIKASKYFSKQSQAASSGNYDQNNYYYEPQPLPHSPRGRQSAVFKNEEKDTTYPSHKQLQQNRSSSNLQQKSNPRRASVQRNRIFESKVGEKSREYEQAFSSKPKLNRSPPRTPQRN